MQDLNIFESHFWNPLSYFGIDMPFFNINASTIIATWAVLGVILILALIIRLCLHAKKSITRYLAIKYLEQFKTLTQENLGAFIPNHFIFVSAVFTFILLCNWIALLPFIEEPTKDINTTLAMALIAFFYKEYYAIKTVGFKGYIAHFAEPFVVMMPLNIIGHLSKIVSMAFRLFGNIFGGAIIMKIWHVFLAGHFVKSLPHWFEESFKHIAGIPMTLGMVGFFVLFEGLIQAFVFAMLTTAYLAIAIQEEEH